MAAFEDKKMWKKRKSKYNNVKTRYKDHLYDSKAEAEFARELDTRMKAGDILAWDKQVKIPLFINNSQICVYVVDFLVKHNNGTKEYIEVKGYKTGVWKLKWKIFETLYSDKTDVKLTVR